MSTISVEEIEGLSETFKRYIERVERLREALDARVDERGRSAELSEAITALKLFQARLDELVYLMRNGHYLEAGVVACELSRRSYEFMEGAGVASHAGARAILESFRPLLASIYYAVSKLCIR